MHTLCDESLLLKGVPDDKRHIADDPNVVKELPYLPIKHNMIREDVAECFR